MTRPLPSSVEIAMIAAPIYAAMNPARASVTDAVAAARQLIKEAAKEDIPVEPRELLSTREAAKVVYDFQKNFPHNWRNQYSEFCKGKWSECIVPALSSSFTERFKNGGEFFEYHDKRGWDLPVVKRIRQIYRAYRTQASRHKIKTKPKVLSK